MVGTLKEMQKLREDANKPDFDQLGFADQMINLISAMPSETTTVQSKSKVLLLISHSRFL